MSNDAGPNHDLMTLYHLVKTRQPSVVIAGHYCLAEHMDELSHDGEAEADSFALGCRLVAFARAHAARSHLVLWVNDIGIDPSSRFDAKDNYRLPDNYREMLGRAGLGEEHLTVLFESSVRNKASTLLRKLYKRRPHLFRKVDANTADLVRCVGTAPCEIGAPAKHAYVINGPDQESLVVKDGPNPKCNLILATLFEDLRARFSPDLFVNVFNDVYQYRLSLGIHVSQQLFDNATPFASAFCDGYDTVARVEAAVLAPPSGY